MPEFNILFGASELSPYAKTGGLGDVMAALPAALKKRGHSVACVLPFYRSVADRLPDRRLTELKIPVKLGAAELTASIWEATSKDGVKIFLVQREEFFDRSQLYGTTAEGDYFDNASRYIFFSKAVVELARYIQPLPQILHMNDWQTGLVSAFVRAGRLPYRCVYTIHNLAYHGSFWAFDFDLTGLPGEYFSPTGVEYFGRLNCMKAGILLSHQITTVSPRYAREIQTPLLGCGLDPVLVENQHKLTGILNGVDYQTWDPHHDPLIAKSYNGRSLAGKTACREALLNTFGLPHSPGPVFGCVARMTTQKGFDLMAEVLKSYAVRDHRIVLLGSGDSFYEGHFQELARQFPGYVGVKIGYDERISHQIVAGSDFFLMPSQFEPCGLTQLYSLRYGTIPIVHDTGGLSDSVEDVQQAAGTGTGIKFYTYDITAFRGALDRALALFANKPLLRKVQRQGMKKSFSWEESAARYEQVYERALAG